MVLVSKSLETATISLKNLLNYPHKLLAYHLAHALIYMQQRWKQLNHFLLNGLLEMDNNGVENQIRPFVLGRKNWLFAGSPNGAFASALFYSLIATAKANDIIPFEYLKTSIRRNAMLLQVFRLNDCIEEVQESKSIR